MSAETQPEVCGCNRGGDPFSTGSQLRSDLKYMRALAEEAMGKGPGKWTANAAFVEWVRTNPLPIMDVLVAAAEVQASPGGLSHIRLYEALGRVPGLRRIA